MLHSRGQLLSDVAAFVKGDAAQLFEIGIEREHRVLAKIPALGNPKVKTMRCVGRELANIVGNQALQERARFWSADGEDSAIVENGSHKREVNLSRKSSSADVAR